MFCYHQQSCNISLYFSVARCVWWSPHIGWMEDRNRFAILTGIVKLLSDGAAQICTPISCVWKRDPCQRIVITLLNPSGFHLLFSSCKWESVYFHWLTWLRETRSFTFSFPLSICAYPSCHLSLSLSLSLFFNLILYTLGRLALRLWFELSISVLCEYISVAFGCKNWKRSYKLDELSADDWSPVSTWELRVNPQNLC